MTEDDHPQSHGEVVDQVCRQKMHSGGQDLIANKTEQKGPTPGVSTEKRKYQDAALWGTVS